jgi:hypothetical protein
MVDSELIEKLIKKIESDSTNFPFDLAYCLSLLTRLPKNHEAFVKLKGVDVFTEIVSKTKLKGILSATETICGEKKYCYCYYYIFFFF